jgi:hypothetical protein
MIKTDDLKNRQLKLNCTPVINKMYPRGKKEFEKDD